MVSPESERPWTVADHVDDRHVKCIFFCLTCRTIIGPVWDDFENKCLCGTYEYEVIRVPVTKLGEKCKKCDLITEAVCANSRLCDPDLCSTSRRDPAV